MKRRHVLRILGSSALIIAAGVGGWASTRDPAAAREPWSLAGGPRYTDPRMQALSYAILAPNPHNRQPWLVDLDEPGIITLYVDRERMLPITDPFDRQITIGLGCFLEILRLAAADQGLAADIMSFPQGEGHPRLDNRPVARIVLTPDSSLKPDPLFRFVTDRRSTKEPFETDHPVSKFDLRTLEDSGGAIVETHGTVDDGMVERLRELTWRGHDVEMHTHSALKESVDLMRIGKEAILANPDGIDLGGPMLEALNVGGLMTHKSLMDPASEAFSQGMTMYREMIMSAMGYVWIVSPANTRMDQIESGRAYVRVNLQATALKLGIHPLSQILQEYEEVTPLLQEVHDIMGVEFPGRIQMLARIGYGPDVKPSPRWPLETRLIS